MSVETERTTRADARPGATHRQDRPTGTSDFVIRWAWDLPHRFAALALMATVFVLLYGGSLDPGPIEARLGLAASESLGPLGQVFGGWDPSVWPGQLAPSLIWAWGEGGRPTSASIRWPAAIAGVVIGLILARRAATTLGGRAGVLVGACWYGSLALMDRSAGAGIDLVTALGTVAVLDRLLAGGSDLVAGIGLAWAFLAGGWPPVAVVMLTTVVLGRPGSTLSVRLLAPTALAAAAWSAWTLSVAPVDAWAAALTLPLTTGPSWWLAAGVLGLALPWSPLAALLFSRSIREGMTTAGRPYVLGWIQVGGACLIAGTVVPGLASAATVPALAALAIAAAAGCDRVLDGDAEERALRWFFGTILALSFVATGLALGVGGAIVAAVPYYRGVCLALITFTVLAAGLAVWSASRRRPVGAVFAAVALAFILKVGHAGYYVPEWNYRQSQGPWGRAVGQWVPPNWPIYTTHTWRADLAFATGHPVRQLLDARHLAYQPAGARFVLLLDNEYAHWPEQAPPLTRVASFQDEHGGGRVLARTPGPLPGDRILRDGDRR